MEIIVLVKEVPDMEQVVFNNERGVIDRSSAKAEMNPLDRNALQAALNIKKQYTEKGQECTITALTMGPKTAIHTLRDAYARGADRCILLSDRLFGGADTLATSRALYGAVQWACKEFGLLSLILCGEKTVDGDTAQVGAELAELLDIPHCCCADKLEVPADGIKVTIPDLCGKTQIRKLTYPALISVTKNAAMPEYATLKRKLASLEIEITEIGYEAVADYIAKEEIGFAGSPTKVKKIEVVPPVTRAGRLYQSYEGFYEALTAKI